MEEHTSRTGSTPVKGRQLSPLIRSHTILLTKCYRVSIHPASEDYELRGDSVQGRRESLEICWRELHFLARAVEAKEVGRGESLGCGERLEASAAVETHIDLEES